MSAWSVILDPVSESATNFELELVGTSSADPIFLLELKLPPPAHKSIEVESYDTEGELYAGDPALKNREIMAQLRVTGSSAATFYASLAELLRSIGKIHAEGGTMRVTPPGGGAVTFDLLGADLDPSFGIDTQMLRCVVEVVFEALPAGRGDEYLTTEVTENTLPVVRTTIVDIPGDLKALGRIILTDAEGVNQGSAMWGLRQRAYSADASAALFYEAEALTPENGAAIATRSGASGGGSNNVIAHTGLATSYQSILRTQRLASSHLSHIGNYRVRARVYDPNTAQGLISLKLGWSEGDFTQWEENAAVEPPIAGGFSIVDLGIITLRAAVSGAQQWQAKVFAKTSDDDLSDNNIEIDFIWLEPIAEGSGRIYVNTNLATPPSGFTARDEFNQAAGALTGEALPVGGTWTALTGSDTDDFQNISGGLISRATTGDTGALQGTNDGYISRIVYASTPSPSTVFIQADFKYGTMPTSDTIFQAIPLRIVDGDTYAALTWIMKSGLLEPQLIHVDPSVGYVASALAIPALANTFYTASIYLDASGSYQVWFGAQGAPLGDPVMEGAYASFPASGKIGLGDSHFGTEPCTRYFDNFRAWVPTVDAAVMASQSLEIRHDRAQREDSGGTLWVPRTDYQGDYALIPNATNEDRTTEIIAKASRNNIEIGSDPAIDNIKLQVGITPRYRVVREP